MGTIIIQSEQYVVVCIHTPHDNDNNNNYNEIRKANENKYTTC